MRIAGRTKRSRPGVWFVPCPVLLVGVGGRSCGVAGRSITSGPSDRFPPSHPEMTMRLAPTFTAFTVPLLVPLLLAVARAGDRPPDDLLVADFEGADYAAWTVTGDAFGSGPARGTLPNQQPVSGFQGKGLINSYLGGDKAQG